MPHYKTMLIRNGDKRMQNVPTFALSRNRVVKSNAYSTIRFNEGWLDVYFVFTQDIN